MHNNAHQSMSKAFYFRLSRVCFKENESTSSQENLIVHVNFMFTCIAKTYFFILFVLSYAYKKFASNYQKSYFNSVKNVIKINLRAYKINKN